MAFVRARCEETGHVTALPEDALKMGMIPGWVAVEGPVPSGPKLAAFPEQYGESSDEDASEKTSEDDADAGEQSPPETADTTSAKKTRS